MRICLLSTDYPPATTEGIARQRQVLARELARQGHDVHVITCGAEMRTRHEQGVYVHELLVRRVNHFAPAYPDIDIRLTASQLLYEGLRRLEAECPCDIVDVPFWALQGFITILRYHGPVALWLQTTSAQLLAINGRTPSRDERVALALERICLEHAGGLLADSRAALDATVRDYQIRSSPPADVVYLGLPPLPGPLPERPSCDRVEALVVGRLERRKGTPLLFELLPTLLREHPSLQVRFVGRDNSAFDGWQSRQGLTYPAFFQRWHPELAGRVIFEGYVDEKRLTACYQHADLLLAPSLYESFGLIYLEAMRAALPVVTFAIGGAAEIFAGGESDGALLAPPGDGARLAQALGELARRPELRRQLGARGLARFNAAFSAAAMAEASVAFYQQVIADSARSRGTRQPIYQVMETLDIGDAVSNIARRNAALLAELGQPPTILTLKTHPAITDATRPLRRILDKPHCGLIFHYWGYSESAWILPLLRGRRAVHYHNITPARYFATDPYMFEHIQRGYAQLRQIADSFDLLIGDSRYNIAEFARSIARPTPAIHLYPVVDAGEIGAAPYDRALLDALRRPGQINIVFVGRVARNKRQDRLIRLFDYYCREINERARLWLVGSDQGDRVYRAELERLRESLASGERIRLTGKVPDMQVNAYYRAADLFVCASEHEGFCMPLAHAMALDVPVLAYAAAAVPETMGGAGVLIDTWDPARVAGLMRRAIEDQDWRARLLAGQRTNLRRFAVSEARARLAAIVGYLRRGEDSPLFDLIGERANI